MNKNFYSRTPFFVNNQKFKQKLTIHCKNRLKSFLYTGNLREMLTFGLVCWKVWLHTLGVPVTSYGDI